MKTGADHIESLRDGRTVYLHGQVVEDVVEHPAYRNAVRSAAHLYDFQAAPENLERTTWHGSVPRRACQPLLATATLVRGVGAAP